MESNMDRISLAIDRKHNMESIIHKLITDYEKDFGLVVNGINVTGYPSLGGTRQLVITCDISV